MGIFANFRALKSLKKVNSGGIAYFTISSITNLIINLPNAQRTLSPMAFQQVWGLYKKLNQCKTRMKLDRDGYLATAVAILKEFDKIAPCESYLGLEPFEARLVMREVRETDL